MVNDMELGDVVHEMLATKPKFAIDRCRGAFQERPSLRLVLRDIGVRVMEVGDRYDPVVDPHVRHHVQQRDGFNSELCACVPESNERQSDVDVGC